MKPMSKLMRQGGGREGVGIEMITSDAPPSSLMDSIVSPKVKTTKREEVGARFLAWNISGVEGHVRALGWD